MFAKLIGGEQYRAHMFTLASLAEIGLDAIDLQPTLEDACVWYLVEAHRSNSAFQKMDTLLGIFMVWRYQ
jgi:hypothetical protein